ncbi:MAG: hypothetical protein DMG05_23965 [Acidobacteria bacterium]|nr:MAG: hypothetical protein DMG05_23965 [Acidobacteriota bacterium]
MQGKSSQAASRTPSSFESNEALRRANLVPGGIKVEQKPISSESVVCQWKSDATKAHETSLSKIGEDLRIVNFVSPNSRDEIGPAGRRGKS